MDLEEIHKLAIKRLQRCYDVQSAEKRLCLSDRRFATIAGGQWESILATSESGKTLSESWGKKPKLEINKIAMSINKIFADFKNNRISVDFCPKDDTENEQLSDTFNGLYRATEQDSFARKAYDNAFNDAITGGFGAFRFTHDYENGRDLSNKKQKIKILPIYDADKTVYFDVNSKDCDKADAKYAFVLIAYEKDYLDEEYGESVASIDTGMSNVSRHDFNVNRNMCYVAEYYVKEEKEYKIFEFYHNAIKNDVFYKDELFLKHNESFVENMELSGYSIRETDRKVKIDRVRKFILSGNKVLKNCKYILGENIPIVPVYGKWSYIDGQERYSGHVRMAKDSQIIKNIVSSFLMDLVAKSGADIPIVSTEQINGLEFYWQNRLTSNLPYLPINSVRDMNGNMSLLPPVGYTQSPQTPPAVGDLMAVVSQEINDLLGNTQKGEAIVSNTSGIAVELAQAQIDLNTQGYMDNFEFSLIRAGHIFLSMARETYVETDRKIKIIKENNKSEFMQINLEVQNPKTGKSEIKNDISNADLDVAVSIGASSKSKKSAMMKNLATVLSMTANPEDQKVILMKFIESIDGEGMESLQEWSRKQLVQMGVEKPNQEEIEQMQAESEKSQEPSPEAKFYIAAAEKELSQAEKMRTGSMLDVAKTQETQAKAEKIFHEMGITANEARMNTLKSFKEMTETAPVPQEGVIQGDANDNF